MGHLKEHLMFWRLIKRCWMVLHLGSSSECICVKQKGNRAIKRVTYRKNWGLQALTFDVFPTNSQRMSMQRKQKKYQKFELLRESKYKMILVRKHERKCQARMPSYEERLWGASVPPLDFLKPGTGGASRAKNVRASSKIFCVAFPGNCTRTCIQIKNRHGRIKLKDSAAGMGGFNMPEPSWRAHIDHFIVARHDGRLDVLQRQVALPLSLIDRRVPTCVHFLRTLAMSETLNSKVG